MILLLVMIAHSFHSHDGGDHKESDENECLLHVDLKDSSVVRASGVDRIGLWICWSPLCVNT